MYRKTLLVGGLALALSAPAATTGPQVYSSPDDPRIVLVDCAEGRGSAVRIGPDLLVSANHVTANDGCKINGQPFKVLYASKSGDFSLLSLKGDGFVKIDCRGFQRGHRYVAVGHARGLQELTVVELVGTGGKDWMSGLAILLGITTVIPGQSGGGIFDKDTAALVGIVNVYDSQSGKSGSREIRDMGVCEGA